MSLFLPTRMSIAICRVSPVGMNSEAGTNQKQSQGWALWFVGLPGSGKSTVARAVAQALKEQGHPLQYLQMDERRKSYFPSPSYTEEERERAYALFAEEAAELAGQGLAVIMDGTAHKLSMRRHARNLIPRFAEIHVRCSLEMAMSREAQRPEGLVMADLYNKALERRRTGRQFTGLGQVIGVDAPFEEDEGAECVLDSEQLSVEESRDLVLSFLNSWLPSHQCLLKNHS